jgi:prophage regulatory protein
MTAREFESLIGHPGGRTNYRMMRLPEVKAITGLSRSTIYSRMALGMFPKQVCLGRRAVGWLEDEIQDWLQHQIRASRQADGSDPSWH